MADESMIQFTFELDDPELEDGEKAKFARKFLQELRNLDEVEQADRVEDLHPEAGGKPGVATLIGVIKAFVSADSIKAFFGFLSERLKSKSIKGSIKVGGKEVTFEVRNPKELEKFEETALNLIAAMEQRNNA